MNVYAVRIQVKPILIISESPVKLTVCKKLRNSIITGCDVGEGGAVFHHYKPNFCLSKADNSALNAACETKH